MTEKEMLQTLSNMLQPINQKLQEIQIDICGLKQDVAGLKQDVAGLKQDVAELKQDVAELKQDVAVLKQKVFVLENDMKDVKQRLTKIELTQENIILPRLQTIESCYLSTYNRYKESVNGYETLKQDVSVLKTVVAEHSKILQRIS